MSIFLTPHFSLFEMSRTSQTNEWSQIIPNAPPADCLHNLRQLCVNVLEPIRDLLDCPLIITSGYRSPEVELKVSGKLYGQHMKGEAADFLPSHDVPIDDAYDKVYGSLIPYDQLLLETNGQVSWIHVSYTDERPVRRQALVSNDNGKTWAIYQPEVKENVA